MSEPDAPQPATEAPAPSPAGDRRHQDQRLAFAVLAALLVLFLAILAAVVLHENTAETKALVGNWGGTILTMIGIVVAYEYGSSKGSRLKDELGNRPPPPAA
jgi:carbohydrate-selective porin OprB